jgi:hypothetical protein
MWFLIPVEKWSFILFAVLYLKKMDEEVRFLPSQYRLCPKAVLATLRLVAPYVAPPLP